MRPASGFSSPTTPLNSVDLPAPFGPIDGDQCAGLDRTVEVMDGRMAVVAERHIAEFERRAHAIAQKIAPHRTAITTAAPASRSQADSRRIEGVDLGAMRMVVRDGHRGRSADIRNSVIL